MVRAYATVLSWKEFLCSVSGRSNLEHVPSLDLQNFQPHRELKRAWKNIFLLSSKNFLEELFIYCFII